MPRRKRKKVRKRKGPMTDQQVLDKVAVEEQIALEKWRKLFMRAWQAFLAYEKAKAKAYRYQQRIIDKLIAEAKEKGETK